jgi:ASC-1-like (ASCH) protein
MKNHHLAILRKPYLDAIIEGRKTIESRLSRTKRSPFGQITVGDKLFLKQASGPVCAVATVQAVRQFENLTPGKIQQLKTQYNNSILGTDEYWADKSNCLYGMLVWLEDIKAINPVFITKYDWRAWVVLTEKEDFGLLKKSLSKQP